MNTPRHTSQSGFTLPELIVVTSVALILLGSLAPALSALRDTTQMTTAINTVSVAVTAARAYATVDVNDLDGVASDLDGFKYSGTAILFTPAGEMRLVRNDQLARNGNNSAFLQPDRNGYIDIPNRDYIKLPRDIGVVGLARNRFDRLLLTPPFAVRFDPHGGLIAAQPASHERVVYYDGNYDGRYTITSVRPNRYNPDTSDPTHNTNFSVSNISLNYPLPFEQIEAVVGVVIYSKRQLRESGNTHTASGVSNPINTSARDWILNNGTVLLFNRYSGAVVKP